MPRSAADATRFTATGPYAASRASTIDISAPPPPNETPAQKVVRLREAARRSRRAEESVWDRVVLRGRYVADKAHRITATALMGLSVLCVGLGTLALAEQISHNRRKKQEWYAEQQRNYDMALERARKAEAEGALTNDLALFLNKERAIEQAEAEQKAKGGIFSKAKKTLWANLSTEEQAGGKLGFASDEVKRKVSGRLSQVKQDSNTSDSELMASTSAGLSELAIAPVAGDVGSNRVRSRGGPLDQLGANAASAVASSSRGLMDWWRSR